MILKGNQRAGAAQLAAHLLKVEENEHVEVYELRGFVDDDLRGALKEAYAISQGTRCKQFMFSLSLNPPELEKVSDRDFKAAILAVEKKLGLDQQPRAIVFHEKEGRRHAHVVWSRIDAGQMKAINLPHYKLKLRKISKELFIKHDWQMPLGLVDSKLRDPANFTREQWQQAKRTGHNPKELKTLFGECWAISDSRKAFAKALEERGFWLARGDRRGYVAVDFKGEIYAVSKWTGQRAKDVKAKLGDANALPSVAETKANIAGRMTGKIRQFVKEAEASFLTESASLAFNKNQLVQRHRPDRKRLKDFHENRQQKETRQRADRLSHGWRGIWEHITGKYQRIKRANEREAFTAHRRDQRQKDSLIAKQLDERQILQSEIRHVRQGHVREVARLHRDVSAYLRLGAQDGHRNDRTARKPDKKNKPAKSRGRSRKRGPKL